MTDALIARVCGIILIAIVLADAFEVMLLPLPVKRRVRFVMFFLRSLWSLWSTLARLLPEGSYRERGLGLFGPLSLILLILNWILGLIIGFGLLQFSLIERPGGLLHALYFSGATFFTLGFDNMALSAPGAKVVAVIEAGCGLGFLALVIGYLPVLYQLFARREAHVMLLDERAGSPPTAVALLQRHAEGHSLEALEILLREWERWSAELLESHMSYPMLSYYRSQFANQSWLAATAAVMDTCALIMVGFDGVTTFQARMSFSVTRLALAELTSMLRIEQVALGATRLIAGEFNSITSVLNEAGLRFVGDEPELQLAKFRATYEPFLGGLAAHLMLAVPPWMASSATTPDNWMKNSRGRIAQQLVESVDAKPSSDPTV